MQPRAFRAISRAWWFVLAAFLILFLPFAAWFFWYTGPVRSAGHEFLSALGTGDYDAAYKQCAPALQTALGGPKRLKQLAEKSKGYYRPSFWTHVSLQGDSAQLESTQGEDSSQHLDSARMQLEKVGGKWKVRSYSASNASGTALRIPPPLR